MKHLKSALTLSLIFVIQLAFSQSKGNAYQYTVDLTRVVDDKVYVELATPTITASQITFYMPKIIPGTYSIADYGRYISDVQAYDKKGNKLTVEQTSDNSWVIKNADKLKKLSYWVDDIMDTEKEGPPIYPMAATNIDADKNFVINTSGFFGYFEGLQKVPFTLNVIRNKEFYGTTGLIAKKTGEPVSKITKEKIPASAEKSVDVYLVDNYDQLIDSPLMYNKPDTAVIRVANTEVLVGAYSPNQKINAKEISDVIRDLLQAQKEYLGGKLPVDKYAFIFYFTDKPYAGFGALEHSFSSFYFLPESGIADMKQTILDVAAHEFFHIVTPLTIHSEEIHHFDFNDPKMSKHLWLYEGVTEYFAGHVQVKYGLITPEQYLSIIRQKMLTASNFLDDVPFTDISKYTLEKYKDQYYNVYQKGALIGMCLDIKLRSLSNGKYGVQNLVADLAKKFGQHKAFQDDELFAEITKLTYPEIGEFLNRYVGGSEKLPFAELLESAGIQFIPEVSALEYSLGFENNAVTVAMIDNVPMLSIANLSALNSQGVAMSFQVGDVLLKINGETIPELGPKVSAFVGTHQSALKEGETLSFTVLRKNEAGEQVQVDLSAPIKKVERKQRFLLSFDANASAAQIALRDAWLTTK
jgi:predicted metalloprotease with PDZ domain